MTANPHLAPILDDWLKLEKPGFALMVTAPWGAGKSSAIKHWLNGKDHVYVSLFGVDSIKAIDEALFFAALDRGRGRKSGKLAGLTARGFDGLAALISTGISKSTNITFDASAAYRYLIRSLLPKLIIFDDLERANMPAPQLLSVLNRYVEHQEKSVLLIANEAELERAPAADDDTNPPAPKSEYRRWREKVVGRTVTLIPETDAALSDFLDALPVGRGKDLLTAQRPLIRDVFNLSRIDNLRLLSQAVIDLCRFLDRLPETYISETKVVTGLVGDFLALSMAWNAGDRLHETDFDLQDGTWARVARRMNGAEPPPLNAIERLRESYQGLAQVQLDGSHLPGVLAKDLIVSGYASDQVIASTMQKAYAFTQVKAPAWQQLARWRLLPEEEVNTAFEALQEQLASGSITDPGVILHAFGIQLGLADQELFGLEKSKVVQQSKDYVKELVEKKRLNIATLSGPARDWMTHDNSHGFGYAQRDTEEFAQIRAVLHDAMLTVAEVAKADQADHLLRDMREDPDRFKRAVYGGDPAQNIPDCSEVALFQTKDPSTVASVLFDLGPDRWNMFLSPFERRIEHQEFLAQHHADNRPTERDWLMRFRECARVLSAACSPLKRAQIHSALENHLSFLDTPPTPNS